MDKLSEAGHEPDWMHNDFHDKADDYRGHGMQVMKHPNKERYVAQAHDLRHPEVEMGSGLVGMGKVQHSKDAAIQAGKEFVDKHLEKEFPKK